MTFIFDGRKSAVLASVLLACSASMATASVARGHARAMRSAPAASQVRSLFVAINAHDLGRVKKLLAAGVNPNGGWDAQTALTEAAGSGDKTIVAALINAHADPNKRNPSGIQPTFYALDHPQVLETLLAHGANPSVRVDAVTRMMNSWQEDGATLLEYAISRSSQKTVDLLLKHKADVNQGNGSGATALHFAVEGYGIKWPGDHVDTVGTVRELLKADADPNRADKNGLTPLKMAVHNGDPELVKLMLAHNAAVPPDSEAGRHLLAEAVKADHHGQSVRH